MLGRGKGECVTPADNVSQGVSWFLLGSPYLPSLPPASRKHVPFFHFVFSLENLKRNAQKHREGGSFIYFLHYP